MNFAAKWIMFLFGFLFFVLSVTWFFNWIELRKVRRRLNK